MTNYFAVTFKVSHFQCFLSEFLFVRAGEARQPGWRCLHTSAFYAEEKNAILPEEQFQPTTVLRYDAIVQLFFVQLQQWTYWRWGVPELILFEKYTELDVRWCFVKKAKQ